MKHLWLAVTTDEYELPLYVADSPEELAKKFGVRRNAIHTAISQNRSGKIAGRKFIKVEVEED